MPVSTRSKRSSLQPKNNDLSQEEHGSQALPIPSKCRQREDVIHMAPLPCSPQDTLKNKMKALTLLYEQHKRALQVRQDDADTRFSTHPSVDLINSRHIDANSKPPNPFKNRGHPDDFKENEFEGFHEAKVARKLSMDLPSKKEENTVEEAADRLGEAAAARILVFVRLRPMAKKEREAGSKCCVRIVNKRDVYLSEFSNENDYLRLKRLRGRHFTFDASFPDSASQQQVYSTT